MKKYRNALLIVVSLLAILASVAWVKNQTAAPIATAHSANLAANRVRPKVSSAPGMAGQLAKLLALNDNQQAKVAKVVEELEPRLASIASDKALSPDKKKAKQGQAMQSAALEVSKLLTPEQNDKFQQMMLQMHTSHH